MKINRYSFDSEAQAEELILQLSDAVDFKQIKETENTVTIICLGFQNEYAYDEETGEQTLIKEGLTYDVDVVWKHEPLLNWSEFEVEPGTPNHSFWID